MSDPLAQKITLNALALAWGWKLARLYRLCDQRQIPFVRIGGRIFFETAALDAWLQAQRQDPARMDDERAEDPDVARVTTRSRATECAALGIPVDHQFT